MAQEFRSEDEQVEALKKWWEDNGKSTIVIIVLALAGSLGWQNWQQRTQGQAEAASTVYQSVLEAINVTAGAAPSAEQEATIRHLAGTLKTDYSGTTYARFAALHLAKMAVNEQDLETAEAELRWVLNSGPDADVELVTQLRLARVIAAGGSPETALTLLRGADTGSYAAAYAEAEGDFQQQLGDAEAALAAYQRAAMLQVSIGTTSQTLAMKLQTLTRDLQQDVVIPELAASED